MQDQSANQSRVAPHSRTAKFFHWGFIGVFIFALTKQLDEVEELEDFSLLQYEMGFAVVFLFLLATRFVFMHSTQPSALPDDTPGRMRLAARVVHLGMYAGLALIPITGLCIGGLYWNGIKQGIAMEFFLLAHEIAVNSSYFLIAAHIAAAWYHRRQNDGIWDAMVPFWKEARSDGEPLA
ncbi:MAG: cytochrome b/b6 domain-containing protein [Pseudomonadota bacterium]